MVVAEQEAGESIPPNSARTRVADVRFALRACLQCPVCRASITAEPDAPLAVAGASTPQAPPSAAATTATPSPPIPVAVPVEAGALSTVAVAPHATGAQASPVASSSLVTIEAALETGQRRV